MCVYGGLGIVYFSVYKNIGVWEEVCSECEDYFYFFCFIWFKVSDIVKFNFNGVEKYNLILLSRIIKLYDRR